MNLTTNADKLVVRSALDEIIYAHGLWPVLKALAARSLSREPTPLPYTRLSNHLRRDIGLPPVTGDKPWSPARW